MKYCVLHRYIAQPQHHDVHETQDPGNRSLLRYRKAAGFLVRQRSPGLSWRAPTAGDRRRDRTAGCTGSCAPVPQYEAGHYSAVAAGPLRSIET